MGTGKSMRARIAVGCVLLLSLSGCGLKIAEAVAPAEDQPSFAACRAMTAKTLTDKGGVAAGGDARAVRDVVGEPVEECRAVQADTLDTLYEEVAKDPAGVVKTDTAVGCEDLLVNALRDLRDPLLAGEPSDAISQRVGALPRVCGPLKKTPLEGVQRAAVYRALARYVDAGTPADDCLQAMRGAVEPAVARLESPKTMASLNHRLAGTPVPSICDTFNDVALGRLYGTAARQAGIVDTATPALVKTGRIGG